MPTDLLMAVLPDLSSQGIGYELGAEVDAQDDFTSLNCSLDEILLPDQPGGTYHARRCSWDRP